ncbi:MAG: hypothetical protein EOO61_03410 [Hymenobacter sp.]|nr:MAG: hypothetical protein EOO61_03410 [Hymenobacter sp.]
MTELISIVSEHYAQFEAGKAENPDLYDPKDEFNFSEYAIFQHIPFDFKQALASNHRGTFPKTWAAEGKNFID